MITDILQYIFIIYLGFTSLYLLFYAVSSYFYNYKVKPLDDRFRRFLILIPAYQEDKVILSTAKEVLKQDYPKELYDVYIIADSFKKQTVNVLNKMDGINCLEVSFDQSTKARSINKALQSVKKDYDGVIIIDADNIMDADFLSKVNQVMSTGEIAIQGHRVAKNQDTSFAILDALSEEINNSIFRKGHIAVGLSSALIGSGMAFDFKFYKSIMLKIDSFADEDKELELKILKEKQRIVFLKDSYVYDEKVNNSKVFVKQRSRWISSQIYYARTHVLKAIYELFRNSNIDFFNKVLQSLLVPRIFLLGISFIAAALSLIFGNAHFTFAWIAILGFCVLALTLSVPKRFYNIYTLKAILSLPYGFLMMLLALFRVKLGHKRFSPTPHHTETHVKNGNLKKKKK